MLTGKILKKEFENIGEVVTDRRDEDKASGEAQWDY